MFLMFPAHGSPALSAQQPGGGQGGRGGAAQAAGGGPLPAIDARTSGMQKLDGYFPLYWDERSGSVFLEIPRFDAEFLFSTGLSAGLGSNDIGLDRGAPDTILRGASLRKDDTAAVQQRQFYTFGW